MKKLTLIALAIFLIACNNTKTNKIERSFLSMSDQNDSVFLYTIKNKNNIEASFTNIGAALTSLKTPDKNGEIEEILLGFKNDEDYLKGSYFGTIIGRFANRIDNGAFTIDDNKYQLTQNNGKNHLHGGKKGFSSVYWTAEPIENEKGIKFTYFSKDGEEGYPGNLKAEVNYILNKQNELSIEYHATTDKPTIINLTNHSFFNLGGINCKTILDHEILINADSYTPVNESLIPTGEIQNVDGTPMDFRTLKPIRSQIFSVFEQLKYAPDGYDHNWVLNKTDKDIELAMKLKEPTTGRVLEIFTTEPGLQFYSGNFFNGKMIGKDGKQYVKYAGLVLETQHFPDSPNHPNFPSVVLRPGEKYYQKSVYKFFVE